MLNISTRVLVAYLAAKNRTEVDLHELKAISARLDEAAEEDVPKFLEENANWHTALAAASHNDLLRAFTASLLDLMLDASRIEKFATGEVRNLVTRAHRRILLAIESQNPEVARRRAERDVQAYAKYLEAALAGAISPTATPILDGKGSGLMADLRAMADALPPLKRPTK